MGCPSESLMCLKPSKSRNSTATFFLCRGAMAIAWLMRSFKQHAIGQAGQKIVLRRMGHLQRHGAGDAHVAEHDHRAGSVPSRSWMGATESSIGISNPSRRIRMQFDGRCTARS